ncbi:NifB/NifX family molybdenum-iron cluster-binding protein [Proteinivorax hydrogeniformans]|uniref:NifB/NifX family molybdenum-iron cluster-binding protein n=1 Tax=Proteinivorax hydrogeniformans TaxID=1826727 RepID=A0AAU8HUA4_9FIRM
MKIAVASEKGVVSAHFNNCQEFTIFKTQGKDIIKKIPFKSYENKTKDLPDYIIGQGVDVVIAGCLGETCHKTFYENDIKLVAGVKGDIDEVVKSYLKGQLKPVEVTHSHQHTQKGTCCSKHQRDNCC